MKHILDLQLWKQIISLQKKLDARILEEKKLLVEKTIDKRFLALLVELSEFSNELRCFKYWSNRMTYKSKELVLDEFIDCLHFLISIGLSFNIDLEAYSYELKQEQDLTLLILETFNHTIAFWKNITNDYANILNHFFTIANILQFSFQDIFQAYLNKNEINHQRIINNY